MFSRREVLNGALAGVGISALVPLLGACGSTSGEQGPDGPANPEAVQRARAELERLRTKVVGEGPNGEPSVPAGSIDLTVEEIEEIRGMGATAALAFFSRLGWTTAHIAGLRSEFGKMGVEVVSVTNSEGDVEKQRTDIETVLARNPDILVVPPVDPGGLTALLKSAGDQGVNTVLINEGVPGLERGKEYVGIVGAGSQGAGAMSAHLLVEAIGGAGKVGLIHWVAEFFHTSQTYRAVKETLPEYPEVEVVEDQGINGPDFAGESQAVASAMMTKYPDLKGIWAVWDIPTEGVIAAARAAGRNDVAVTTVGYSENVAIDMARDGVVKGIAVDRPYDMGVTQAKLAAYGLLGKEAPPFVALTALPATQKNAVEAWEESFGAAAPRALREAAG